MKRTLTLLFLLLVNICIAQHFERSDVPSGLRNTAPLTTEDAAIFNNIEELRLPANYTRKSLPDSIDNSIYKWFRRPIFSQTSYPNCMQSTSIAYNFTYEINRLRDVSGDDPNNQYTTHFAWNFFNGGMGWYGVNYLFTMDVLKYHGTPSNTDYGGFYYGGGERWMSGYDAWYNAMNNRISGIKKIYVGNEEGLLTLKHWLNDHLDGSASGGLASFIACSPWEMTYLPPESPQAGKHVIVRWCPEALHGMTIVGYNDSIRYDYNEDGYYTNDIDLNDDGVIDMSDWEIGAVKFCNSYGETWADSGFCYMMYKALADDFGHGGIWTNTVHVLEAKAEHNTRMTYKVTLEHDYRERIRVQAGISSNLETNKPEQIHSYTIFNFQGGWHFMQGNDTTSAHKTIEFGLDVSPLLSYVDPGKPYKFFLIVDEKDPENLGHGQIKNFSLIDYQDGMNEVICDEQNVPLVENGRTLLSVIYTPPTNDLEIITEGLSVYEPNQPMVVQLEAEGGQEPYRWQLDRNYLLNKSESDFPGVNQNLLIENSLQDSLAMQVLEFDFPFYGNVFDTVMISSSGYVYFDENMYFWSYLVDLAYFLRNSRVIAPLICQELSIYPGYGLGVWYEGNENKATFRWKTAYSENFETTFLNFALTLHPDGTIEFYYDDMSLSQNIRWTAGISDGDYFNNNLPILPDPPDIPAGTKVEFFPKHQPGEISLSRDGELSILESEESILHEVKVVVTDNTLLSDAKAYFFTDALEFSLSIQGDNDLVVSNGQITDLDLVMQNRGSMAMQDIDLSLSCSHPLLDILISQYHIDEIASGETIEIPEAFSCFCSELMSDDQKMILKLDAVGQNINYKHESYLRSVAPALELSSFEVLNGLNLLEPGKTEDLQLRLVNNGSSKSINTRAALSSDHPGILVNTEQPLNIGTIGSGNSTTIEFNLSANYSISFGSEVNFLLELTDEIGLITEIPFSMRIGRTPVYIIDMDPLANSGAQIHEWLQQMDVVSHYTLAFPLSIMNYQSVILCLGKHFTNHELTWSQGVMLEEYLDQGGKLYMEGRLVWQQEPYLPILDRFGFGTITSPGMYEVLDGVDSTFTQGLSYENEAQQPFSYCYLEPVPPAFSIFTGREYPNCAAVAYDAGSYKTIGTIFELGTLISSDTCQIESFMQAVLDFFEIKQNVIGIEEIKGENTHVSLQNYPNPFSHQTRIPLKLENKGFVDAGVYNIQGRRIYNFIPATMLEAGTYHLSWNGKGADGHPAPPGIYIYRILVDGSPITGKMILIR